MKTFVESIGPNNLSSIVILFIVFLNEYVHYKNDQYYTAEANYRGIFNRMLNKNGNLHKKDGVSAKRINQNMFVLTLISLVVGGIVMFQYNIMFGMIIYLIMMKFSTYIYCVFLAKKIV